MGNAKKIVTVWLDETSDADEPKFIVDVDVEGGGESTTIKTFDDLASAMEFAGNYARKHGLKAELV